MVYGVLCGCFVSAAHLEVVPQHNLEWEYEFFLLRPLPEF
jgi:hypothetical protein